MTAPQPGEPAPLFIERRMKELWQETRDLEAFTAAFFDHPDNRVPGHLRMLPNSEILPQTAKVALSQMSASAEVAIAMMANAIAMQSAFLAFLEHVGMMPAGSTDERAAG